MFVTYATLMFQYIYALHNLLYSLTGSAQEILGLKATIKMRHFLTFYIVINC